MTPLRELLRNIFGWNTRYGAVSVEQTACDHCWHRERGGQHSETTENRCCWCAKLDVKRNHGNHVPRAECW